MDNSFGSGLPDFNPNVEIARDLEVLQNEIRELGESPLKPLRGRGPALLLGLDAEWVNDPKNPDSNNVLSYQFYAVGERGHVAQVLYPSGGKKSDRLRLKESVMLVIKAGMKAGKILEWPREVVICGFFLRADLVTFSDFSEFKVHLDSVGGSVATTKGNVQYVFNAGPEVGVISKVKASAVVDVPRDRLRVLSLRFIDLALHVSLGTTLSQIGHRLGLRKIALPDGHIIERMDRLLEADRASFERYGLRDAEIPVRYYQFLKRFSERHAGKGRLAVSVGSLAVRIATKEVIDSGLNYLEEWGKVETSVESWDDARGSPKTTKIVTWRPEVLYSDRLIIDCYHGGHSQAFHFGPSDVRVWNDFDLTSAYTNALVDLRRIDYEKTRHTNSPADFCGHVVGFAYLEFSFPEGTRYPMLPVRSRYGLVFPLSGVTTCTAPEIEVALSMGCEIKIRHGVIFPFRDGDQRVFEPFVVKVRRLRSEHPKGSDDEVYAKLVGNSLYGKLGQGLKGKRVYEPRSDSSVFVQASSATHPVFAAHATGLVRAVMGEIIARIPAGRLVLSVSTDGIITDATADELDLDGPISRRFQGLCERFDPNARMMESKHEVAQVLLVKNRAQATLQTLGDGGVILARGGVSPPVPKAEQNQYIVDLFMGRTTRSQHVVSSFPSIRAQWKDDLDMVKMARNVRLSYEYDMKRRPVAPRMGDINGIPHLAFETLPWRDVKEAEGARAYFDSFRRGRLLKTLADFQAWDEQHQFNRAVRARRVGRKPGVNMTEEGAVGVARRMFLRMWTQDLLGVERRFSYAQLAKWLTERGYGTTVDDLKNAGRSKAAVVDRITPRTEKVTEFLELLVQEFPGIDPERFLIPHDPKRV